MELDEKIYLGKLFDCYGKLLTNNQYEIINEYLFKDISLTELAELRGASRQSVYDSIKISTELLKGYESKLHMYSSLEEMKCELNKIIKTSKIGEAKQIAKKILGKF